MSLPLRMLILPASLLLLGSGCQTGWDDRPVDDDDDSTFPTDDDDSTFPTDDDDATSDDDDATSDDDDSTSDDDDATSDDDDATSDDDDDSGDDDDATSDDDDATGDDDDSTPNPNDGDGDGYEGPFGDNSDCDDLDAAVNPGAVEDPSNSVDDDCDGDIDEAGSIDDIVPADGIAAGGTLVTVEGEGFLAITAATLGTTSITPGSVTDTSFTFVSPGGPVGDEDLEIITSFETLTFADAFTYTGTSTSIDSAELIGPATTSGAFGAAQGPYTASVTEAGTTGTGSAPSGIIAQVGYGTQGQLPTTWPDYFFDDATWSMSDGGSDVFSASVTPHTYGTWMVVFRFSDDSGYNWLYADTNAATALDALELGQATVTPPSP
ncbi:MAG: IPT/TIG domain-containing protein [Deltaproteobacteria bacterium]|nr:IPT/TIG domain-containing protein [Deltaproteobacteria bacterium]